jgi:hypothetical protein
LAIDRSVRGRIDNNRMAVPLWQSEQGLNTDHFPLTNPRPGCVLAAREAERGE